MCTAVLDVPETLDVISMVSVDDTKEGETARIRQTVGADPCKIV